MKTADTQELLETYAKSGSEVAFRELVGRYIGLVYATAARLTGGDTHLAEDVAQVVFLHLARHAHTLSRPTTLGGWLHRDTCNVAASMMRSQRRRQVRERRAMEMRAIEDHTEANLAKIAPALDEAINRLGAEDRMAIMLRFFEHYDFSALGTCTKNRKRAAVNRDLPVMSG